MSRKHKLLAKTVPGNGVVTAVAKDVSKVKLRATIYPSGGAQPYEEDISVQDDGTFTLEGSSLTYHVSHGSVIRCLDGLLRTNVHEAQPNTINIGSLRGENIMHPMTLNAIARNNYWQQWGDFLRSQSLGRKIVTWGMMAAAVIMIIVTVWQVATIGDGFDELAKAFGSAAASNPPVAGPSNGHNQIAPGA